MGITQASVPGNVNPDHDMPIHALSPLFNLELVPETITTMQRPSGVG